MGRGISGHCGQVQLLLVILLQGPLNRMPGQGEGEGYIMALIRSGYHCAESGELPSEVVRVVCAVSRIPARVCTRAVSEHSPKCHNHIEGPSLLGPSPS